MHQTDNQLPGITSSRDKPPCLESQPAAENWHRLLAKGFHLGLKPTEMALGTPLFCQWSIGEVDCLSIWFLKNRFGDIYIYILYIYIHIHYMSSSTLVVCHSIVRYPRPRRMDGHVSISCTKRQLFWGWPTQFTEKYQNQVSSENDIYIYMY